MFVILPVVAAIEYPALEKSQRLAPRVKQHLADRVISRRGWIRSRRHESLFYCPVSDGGGKLGNCMLC